MAGIFRETGASKGAPSSRAERAGRVTGSRRSGPRTFSLLFPDAEFDHPACRNSDDSPLSRDDALLALVTGWMSHLGPATARNLANCSGFLHLKSKKPCCAWKPAGAILRGQVHRTRHRGGGARRHTNTGVVRAAAAGAYSSPDRRHAAQADRAGHRRAVHALALALAACRAGNAGPGRTGHARSAAAAAGIRNSRQCLGAADPGAAHCQLRSQVARPTLPHRRSGLGTVVSASRDSRRFCCRQAASDSDQRGSDHIFRSRRGRLDDSASIPPPSSPKPAV